jgi:hypothetical protein
MRVTLNGDERIAQKAHLSPKVSRKAKRDRAMILEYIFNLCFKIELQRILG